MASGLPLLPRTGAPAGSRPAARAIASAALLSAALLLPASSRAAAMGAPKAPPMAEALSRTHAAAEAVLAEAGAETCLRGKLTNALLGLSSSCAAGGERSALCRLADSAAVVTPMTLAFMKETATRLLALMAAPEAMAGSGPASAPVQSRP